MTMFMEISSGICGMLLFILLYSFVLVVALVCLVSEVE